MSGREAILGKVRSSLGAASGDSRTAKVAKRLKDAPSGIIPLRGQKADKERIALFCEMAHKVSATVERVKAPADVPKAVAAYLRAKNLPAAVRMGADERLGAMPWKKVKALEVKPGPADPDDQVGVSHAIAGIAETGTVALHSGAENPTTVNFLPEHHIVVVNAKDIAGDLETVFSGLRRKFGKGTMPRTLNLITGPSRSGDIEQTLLLGAHGPRALHLVVVDGG
ncbi:lactate utilization protein [Chelativorans sp. M5D2P16]|uniref:LutC/YkgG family protein n=1 Tax=Chelativorans sp. M5D2P16 TaxID=3095678 RepID=UPI002AC9F998|nr:lactate utilization protein [Chelativorans sp. M5D2P16]MDZ5698939.1 lactate utilization protein [Chelativorans sp. M5D2P16]